MLWCRSSINRGSATFFFYCLEQCRKRIFPDSTGITAIYEPSEGDLEAGAAPIMAIAAGTGASSSFPDTASAVIPVIAEPVVNAGENIASCGDNQIYLTGEASGYNSGSILWTTSGDGSFQNNNMLNTYYSPGSQDMKTGRSR
ncbi:MAG: hypothetical protein U5L09_08615 [Bacteroidales bacterium]|nr:hypothetical protein [Bacteroidales bacterium]